MDFPLSVQVPDKAGTTLTFKALQTYDDGKVVRWIGPAGSDEPAPQVKVGRRGGEGRRGREGRPQTESVGGLDRQLDEHAAEQARRRGRLELRDRRGIALGRLRRPAARRRGVHHDPASRRRSSAAAA